MSSSSSNRPDTIAGVPVYAWEHGSKVARDWSVDERTLIRWRQKGLPSWGEGRDRRYPIPHGNVWVIWYRVLLATEGMCRELSMERAFELHES